MNLLSSARAAVVGLHAAIGEAASRACAWVFMYLLDLNICVLIIKRAAVVGLHATSGEAASRACAWVFMYLFDLNICVLINECRRRESSGRRTARG